MLTYDERSGDEPDSFGAAQDARVLGEVVHQNDPRFIRGLADFVVGVLEALFHDLGRQ